MHDLVNGAENGMLLCVQHLNSHPVAMTHVSCPGLPVFNHFTCPQFGNAGVASAWVLVADRAGTNNAASAHTPCFADMGNQLREVEYHIDPGISLPHQLPIPENPERQMQFSTIPGAS
jgi:hypothetical protein